MVEKGLSRLLAFLREEEERERLEEIERLKPIGTPVGSYLEYRWGQAWSEGSGFGRGQQLQRPLKPAPLLPSALASKQGVQLARAPFG